MSWTVSGMCSFPVWTRTTNQKVSKDSPEVLPLHTLFLTSLLQVGHWGSKVAKDEERIWNTFRRHLVNAVSLPPHNCKSFVGAGLRRFGDWNSGNRMTPVFSRSFFQAFFFVPFSSSVRVRVILFLYSLIFFSRFVLDLYPHFRCLIFLPFIFSQQRSRSGSWAWRTFLFSLR